MLLILWIVILGALGIWAWKKDAKLLSTICFILLILGAIMYFETGPGSEDYQEYDNGGSNPSFKGNTRNVKGACKHCNCQQYDGVYQGYWPNCSCGHSYAGHETK